MTTAPKKSSFNGMDWVYGIWYVSDGVSQDWMGTLGKAEGKWQFEYRFRYYVDDLTHNSNDRKSWYAFGAKDDSDASRDSILAAIKPLIDGLIMRYRSAADFIDLQCGADDSKILFELGSRPWAHVKHGSDAEAILNKET